MSPFIGLHLVLALGLGWLFGLNRFKVYLAANISNPVVAPLIYAIEIQVGTWFRTGRFHSIDTIGDVRLTGLGLDILVGSVIVGVALAIVGIVPDVLERSAARGRSRSPSPRRRSR